MTDNQAIDEMAESLTDKILVKAVNKMVQIHYEVLQM